MGIENSWLIENITGAYPLGEIDDGVDGLIESYDSLLTQITEDERNYMAEAISTTKDKIITSKVAGVVSLVDPDAFVDGTDFSVDGAGIIIEANKFTDGEAIPTAWTPGRMVTEMDGVFLAKSETIMSPVASSYLSAANLITVSKLESSSDAMIDDATEKTVGFAKINMVDVGNENAVFNTDAFKNVFIQNRSEGITPTLSLNIDSSLYNIDLRATSISHINHNLTDVELKGAGSKLSDYSETASASPATDHVDNIFVVLNGEDTYVVTVDGSDYSYSAQVTDTSADIAAGIQSSLSGVSNMVVTRDVGYWSKVFENTNTERPIGWFAENINNTLSYEVEMILRTEAGDLTIEQDGINPEKIIIHFEHDGFDPIYPTIEDIVLLTNGFGDVDIEAVLMSGYSSSQDATVDSFTLETGDSQLILTATEAKTISTANDYRTDFFHVSSFGAAVTQAGTVEVIRFSASDTFTITIDGTAYDIIPGDPGFESVVSDITLAVKFMEIINAGSDASATLSNLVMTIMGLVPGTAFTVTTSGEVGYTQPAERDTLLKYDIRNHLLREDNMISQLLKPLSAIRNLMTPLSKSDLTSLLASGYIYHGSALFLPQVPSVVDDNETLIPRVSYASGYLEARVRLDMASVLEAHNNVSQISRSMPELKVGINATEAASSNRWYFVEAGGNGLASKTSLSIALETVSPKDYERLVFQDANATFSTLLEDRLPDVGQTFESILSLLTKDIPSYNKGGLYSSIDLNGQIFDKSEITSIKAEIGEGAIDSFIKYALLPSIASIDTYLYLLHLAIQIDDAFMEQRFIALSAAMVADSSQLASLFSDPHFCDYVFGVNEAEVVPENNYGLGGIPIDGTVTMDKLYFRNMRNLAIPPASKEAAIFSPENLGTSIFSVVSEHALGEITTNSSSEGKSVVVTSKANSISSQLPMDMSSIVNGSYIGVGDIGDFDSDPEDFIMEELIRTGGFTARLDTAIGHARTCHSLKFNASVFEPLMDLIEITSSGSIVSINNGKSLTQALYQSFDTVSPDRLITMLAKTDSMRNANSANNIYSAYSILSTKIALYLKENDGTIDYAAWPGEYEEIIGRLFLDDELETGILPYDVFECWMVSTGIHNLFAWAADVETSVLAIYSGLTTAGIPLDGIVSSIKVGDDATSPLVYTIEGMSHNSRLIPKINVHVGDL